jgi:hypothetical protein
MPHPNALSLASLEGLDFLSIYCKINLMKIHYTTVPFGVVVSSLDSHQAVWGSNLITSQIIFIFPP